MLGIDGRVRHADDAGGGDRDNGLLVFNQEEATTAIERTIGLCLRVCTTAMTPYMSGGDQTRPLILLKVP